MIVRRASSQLVVIDIQERLAPAMSGGEVIVANVVKLLRCAGMLDVPVTLSEQYRKGIGATLPAVMEAAGNRACVFEKMAFSAMRDADISRHIDRIVKQGRRQIVLCGIEAHVCVLQTALDLAAHGREVAVVADAIASRTVDSKTIALQRLAAAGVTIATTEMVAFEWLEMAGTGEFRALLPLLK